MRDLKLWAEELRGLFFPRKCVVCGRFLAADEQDLCGACMEELPLTYQWSIGQHAGFERLARRFDVEAAASLFFFGSESDYKHILYSIKYGGRRKLGYRMGYLLGSHLAESRLFARCQAVVPVPLHPLRRWKRGYNQAEEIARGVAAAMGLPLETKLLRRRRYTKTQTKLQGSDKTTNVLGAFAVDNRRAQDLQTQDIRHLLLVDDVLTTGSTLAASAAPLIDAHFKVSCTTLAFVG